MFSFFTKQKSAFGLDISETTLRMIQLESRGEGLFPSAFVEAKLPKGLVREDQILNAEELARAITQNRERPTFGKFTSSFVVVSVPESKSFVRVITVPRMTEAEAAEAVPFEAEQYIPVSADQVYLDFKILPDSSSSRDPDKMRVVIAATPKNFIERYLEVIKAARLKPVAIEVESEAIARALIRGHGESEPVLILDVSSTHTTLIIFDAGALQFTSSVPVAGDTFTSQISQHLTISFEEADKLKRQIGLTSGKDGGRIRAALVPVLTSLVEAVSNSINFYKEHSEGGRQVGQILLCGGGSKLKGLPEYLASQVGGRAKKEGITVQIGDPWVNVLERPIKKVPPISKTDSVSFVTAIGLALRGVKMQ